MDKILIEGGIPLKGVVEVSGSKNSALPCLFATLLTEEECVLENVPDLVDIDTACSLLSFLGKKVNRKDHTVTIQSGTSLSTEAPYDLVRRMRASALVLGPLLARLGHASASLPGGCAIGVRPIDIHLSGFERLGAETQLSQGIVTLKARKLLGKRIDFAFPSVGATENLLMASALAQGRTVIHNAAREPEIVDCANFLNKMGAEIEGAGSKTIHILGKKSLRGARHRVIPDRIETATYLLAAAATQGELLIQAIHASHNQILIQSLEKIGMEILADARNASLICRYFKPLKPLNIVTGPYPKFPTDVQAQWMTLMTLVSGKSVIQEAIFENRFLHAAELCRMGARIEVDGNRAFVTGVKQLSGADVMVSDLRAGAAMVIAGLVAKGKTRIHRIYHLDRGYENLEEKLRNVGAQIKRVH
ncbi:MAG: UDP-N-acetylglucosamine 1-carboxyvinyltransferase [Elusimicrobia bacterium]|nr:UDP-N-acetylglucosamine 1-carboxyvinyltransferase [Elusimicrobiota bacterium]